ncbi:hypothetical protein [Insolitispirillum peregrinum]|uniref:hypothetical protein n=1 Tax=Insolitispirillum peregrinum TaxID=80876 RepID=UPI0009705055|nr:hypothetical protein [Insolitispirillum peregrinum]
MLHGAAVETHPAWGGDAVWPGAFETPVLTDGYLLGSAISISGEEVVYSSSFHSLSRLHIISQGSRLIVSNSLAFALALADDELDEQYPLYARDLYSVRTGMDHCKKKMPTRNGSMSLLYGKSIRVTRDLVIRHQDRVLPDDFDDFAGYKRHVLDAVAALSANAADPRRKKPLKVISTLSSGYDSACCTIVAHSQGCNEAISVVNATKSQGDMDDSGKAIAETLGLTHYKIDQNDYLTSGHAYEAEFIAANPTGEDIAIAGAEHLLSGRLLLIGHHGDKVWTPNITNATDYKRGDASGGSLVEFALRVGIVLLPMPFIGAHLQPKINRISSSAEMKTWWIPGNYNRPIPRRIIEDHGIRRGDFATDKKAISNTIARIFELKDRLENGQKQAGSYKEYARSMNSRMGLRARLSLLISEKGSLLAEKIVNRVNWMFSLLRIPYRFARPFRGMAFRLGANWPIYHWAVTEMRARYKSQIDHPGN